MHGGTSWFHLVPCGSVWFHVVLCGSAWFRRILCLWFLLNVWTPCFWLHLRRHSVQTTFEIFIWILCQINLNPLKWRNFTSIEKNCGFLTWNSNQFFFIIYWKQNGIHCLWMLFSNEAKTGNYLSMTYNNFLSHWTISIKTFYTWFKNELLWPDNIFKIIAPKFLSLPPLQPLHINEDPCLYHQ